MWLTYLAAAMQALTALEEADQDLAPILKLVNTTVDNAQAQGNRDPTPEERAELDDVIKAQMAKVDQD